MQVKSYQINNETKTVYESSKDIFINSITIVNRAATTSLVSLHRKNLSEDFVVVTDQIALIPENTSLTAGAMVYRENIVLLADQRLEVTTNALTDIDINIF